ncbi:MAG: UDP-3-O-(3-hydroxymyristoyl)glucosamine N-acyltransferase [Verrucomicrobiota bacterium]
MKPPVTLEQLTTFVPDSRLHGDGSISVTRFVPPNEARSDEDLPLIMSLPVAEAVKETKPLLVKAAVLAESVAEKCPALLDRLAGALLVRRPRLALVELNSIFLPDQEHKTGIHPSAVVHESATIDPTASIGPFVCIAKNVRIGPNSILTSQISIQQDASLGSDCLIHPGVRIGPRVQIGHRVIIQSNACIGSDGFSYVTPQENSAESVRDGRGLDGMEFSQPQLRIESLGNVVLEDDVDVGAGTTIDLATLGSTIVRRGTKIDNLVQIGHNNTIGEDCVICAQVGIAGSCKIGDGAILAGQVGIADHLTIGERSVLMAKTGVIKNIEADSILFGYPSMPHRDALRAHALIQKLGDMNREIRRLQKRVDELEGEAS